MTFKDRLREEIAYKGFSLKELAAMTNISKGTLESYTNSRGQMPAADVAVRLAQALGVTVEYLVTGSTSTKNFELEKYMEVRKSMEHMLALPEEVQHYVKVMLEAGATEAVKRNRISL